MSVADAKFRELDDARQFSRVKGRRDFTVCATTDKEYPWEVREKTDTEREQDAYWLEDSRWAY